MDNTKYGTIATGSKEASLTAQQILQQGGNAFDAAIAAVFTSMTSEFALTGPFGGGTCVGVINNNKSFVYDFFVDSPEKKIPKKEFKEIFVNFGNTRQKFHIGSGSIATPGNIGGLYEIHKNHGILPLSEILKPAIKYAEKGVVLGAYQSYIFELIKPILSFSKNELFFKNHKFIKKGDVFKNPKFAKFLNILLKEGPDYFYKGKGLVKILEALDEKSCLTKNDFTNYSVYKRKPISLNYKDYTIYTNPAPSHGGSLIIFLLKLLLNSKKSINTFNLIKGMNLSSRVREEICRNPDVENEIEGIFSKNILTKYSKIFLENNSLNFANKIEGLGSTTHVSVLDKQGNAASITTTNGEGCGSIISEYGIMMNNMLGETDLNPFGFHKWKNRRRLPTMISPIIITQNNKVKYVLGSGGSNRIRSANIQVILNLLEKNMNLKDAISAPRVHLEGNILFYEPNIQLPKINKIKLNAFNKKNLFFGGVNAVSENEAVGDERRGGEGIIT